LKDIIEYKLLTGKDNSEFCNRVTEFLNDGWELYGSPFMNITGIDFWKARIVGQAVVKRK
tara:strand:- start:1212 stop:1391 length:180 start_codon:yes stop_codon:yes gene_type:complete